ncbi:MAG: site-specific integrase [Candidatus Omnitrophica bacterium]|nr:site-specific integrase [Candidatus Omnitrophota bacterium]
MKKLKGLKQKKNGMWMIDYRSPNGKRRRETIGYSRKLAEAVLAKRKVEIAEGRFLDVCKKEKIKFEDFAAEFLNIHCKANKKSWKSDFYNLETLKGYFGGKYLYTIAIKDIEKFKLERSGQVGPATVNRELATLKTMFSKAVIWDKLHESTARNVKFLKEPAGRLRFLEREEIVKVLANCNKRLRPVVVLALNTGMRRGELFGLKWHDVDFKNNIITLLDTKNGEKREVYINEQVKTALIRVRKHPESPYIFCNSLGKPCHDIRKSFFTALKKSGIKDFHFHDLRHTFASQLVMSGIDINTVRELLGHKDIRMTLRYSHLSPSHKKHAVDVLGRRMDTFWTLSPESQKSENSNISQTVDIELVK